MTFGRNFLPGPTDVHPAVLRALDQPMFGHRSPRMQAILSAMQPALQALFGTTQPVFISTSSATGLIEASVRNGVRERVLVVAGGYFGEMYARVAEACGKGVIRLHVHPGQAVEPDALDSLLDGPPVDAVALVHSESSTGALAPLPELAEVVRRREDVLLLVDGVTSVGAVPIEMDRWGADFVLTGSQKAMALPPGIALGAASRRFLARAEKLRDAGFYFSVPKLVKIARESLPFWTPAMSLILALDCQMKRIAASGGLPARFERHRRMGEIMAAWAENHPRTPLLAPPGRRSPAISSLRLPAGHEPGAVAGALEERGYLVGTGLDPRHGALLRIGHMGDLEPEHLAGLLAELEEVLR
jgi:aspartate aminotransferase-like enzyme